MKKKNNEIVTATTTNALAMISNVSLNSKSLKLVSMIPNAQKEKAIDVIKFNQINDTLSINGSKLFYDLSVTIDKKRDGFSFGEFCKQYLDIDSSTASRMVNLYKKFGLDSAVYERELGEYYKMFNLETTCFNITSLSRLAELDITTLKELCIRELLNDEMKTALIKEIVPLAKKGDFDGVKAKIYPNDIVVNNENNNTEGNTEGNTEDTTEGTTKGTTEGATEGNNNDNTAYTMSFEGIETDLNTLIELITETYEKGNTIKSIVWNKEIK